MQAMRDLLRTSLAKSLAALGPLDRLAAAWPVAAGHAIAERTSVTALEETVATVTVPDAGWQRQLREDHDKLLAELSRVSRIPLTDILFLLPQTASASERKPPATRNRKPQRLNPDDRSRYPR